MWRWVRFYVLSVLNLTMLRHVTGKNVNHSTPVGEDVMGPDAKRRDRYWVENAGSSNRSDATLGRGFLPGRHWHLVGLMRRTVGKSCILRSVPPRTCLPASCTFHKEKYILGRQRMSKIAMTLALTFR